jgi:hypothetical protein
VNRFGQAFGFVQRVFDDDEWPRYSGAFADGKDVQGRQRRAAGPNSKRLDRNDSARGFGLRPIELKVAVCQRR